MYEMRIIGLRDVRIWEQRITIRFVALLPVTIENRKSLIGNQLTLFASGS
jgi:hypothetical protein